MSFKPHAMRATRNGKNIQLNWRHAFILIASIATVGCGGAPSDSDMKAALEFEAKSGLDAARSFGGQSAVDMTKSMTGEIKNVKKIGCKDDSQNAFKCDVELVMEIRGAERKGIVPVRFVKSSDGWRVTK